MRAFVSLAEVRLATDDSVRTCGGDGAGHLDRARAGVFLRASSCGELDTSDEVSVPPFRDFFRGTSVSGEGAEWLSVRFLFAVVSTESIPLLGGVQAVTFPDFEITERCSEKAFVIFSHMLFFAASM